MTYFVAGRGDKYHGWPGCWALKAGQASADSQEGYERQPVQSFDSEDDARDAALEHARCEVRACFARGRGLGLAALSEEARKAMDDPSWRERVSREEAD